MNAVRNQFIQGILGGQFPPQPGPSPATSFRPMNSSPLGVQQQPPQMQPQMQGPDRGWNATGGLGMMPAPATGPTPQQAVSQPLGLAQFNGQMPTPQMPGAVPDFQSPTPVMEHLPFMLGGPQQAVNRPTMQRQTSPQFGAGGGGLFGFGGR